MFCRKGAAGRPTAGSGRSAVLYAACRPPRACRAGTVSNSCAHPSCWVPEGSLAGIFGVGFRPIFGQTWPQNPSRTTGLVLQCRLHQKSARQTNSKAISWHQQIPARLPSGTQPDAPELRVKRSGFILVSNWFAHFHNSTKS